MTYNICTGGVDDDTTSRLDLIYEVIAAASPDILAIQEANEFDLRAFARFFAFEQATGLRGLFSRSPSEYHGALFFRRDLQPITHRVHSVLTQSVAEVTLGGAGPVPLTVCAVHYDSIAPSVRLTGTLYSLNAGPAIVLGDFNNIRGDDPHASEAYERFSPRHKARQVMPQVDDRLFHTLEAAGFEDLYRRFHPGGDGYTTLAAGGLRLDYIFATRDLADRALSCDVFQHQQANAASDHFPVIAEFDL